MVKSPFGKLSASIRLTPSRNKNNKNQQNERDEEAAPLNNKRIPGSGATSSSPYAASSNDGQNGCVRFAPAGPSMLYQLASSSSDLFNTQQQQQAQHGGAFASQPNFGWRRLEQQAMRRSDEDIATAEYIAKRAAQSKVAMEGRADYGHGGPAGFGGHAERVAERQTINIGLNQPLAPPGRLHPRCHRSDTRHENGYVISGGFTRGHAATVP